MAHSNEQAAHIWAQQNGKNGKAGNMYSDGTVIYSYGPHYPIANFARPNVVLFNDCGSTKTTQGKHKPAVREALRGLRVRVFNVRNPQADSEWAHGNNLEAMRAYYDSLVVRIARARSNSEYLANEADELANDARAYAETFGVTFEPFPAISPELLARAKDEAAKASKEKAAKTAERKRLNNATAEVAAAEWRAGTRHSFAWNQQPEITMLRLSNDGNAIQTSRGARVPVSVAPVVWRAATQCRKTGRPHTFSTPRPQLGPFTLDYISHVGDIQAGCHSIPFEELRVIARALNYADAEAL